MSLESETCSCEKCLSKFQLTDGDYSHDFIVDQFDVKQCVKRPTTSWSAPSATSTRKYLPYEIREFHP